MIDRQELMKLLEDKIGSAIMLPLRQELADAILDLDKPLAPDVADTGTIFPELKPDEYAGGYHYPHGSSPGHPLIECNRRGCGPRLR